MSTPTITMNIYGSDADYIASETPDVTQSYFTSLSNLISVAVSLYDAGYETKLESEVTTYADDRNYVTKTFRGSYKVKVKYRAYPTTATTVAAYCPELAVLKKVYNWIKITGYNIGFTTANIAQAVNIIGWSETKFHEWTMLEFEFEHRKVE